MKINVIEYDENDNPARITVTTTSQEAAALTHIHGSVEAAVHDCLSGVYRGRRDGDVDDYLKRLGASRG